MSEQTITAKNYVAQLVRGFKTKNYGKVSSICEFYESATHFVIPDGGRIMGSQFKGLRGQTINLPYECITIEFFHPNACVTSEGKILNGKRVILARQFETGGKIYYHSSAFILGGMDYWAPLPFVAAISPVWDETFFDSADPEGGLSVVSDIIPIEEEMTKMAMKDKAIMGDIANEMGALLALCEALSCSNVSAIPVENIAPGVNTRRIKAGRLPFYETKMLIINAASGASGGKSVNTNGSSHASPRQHLRRGHIRRLASGNIWVNSCVVGDSTSGYLSKTYIVK